jgi:polyisoprenoid-binding protein YceI
MKKLKLLSLVAVLVFAVASCAPRTDRKAEILEKLEMGEIPEDVDVLVLNTSLSEVAWEGKRITGSGHDGTIGVKEGKIYAFDGALLGGEVYIDMTRIVVLDLEDPGRNARLKGHLESDDFFSVADYPLAKLEIVRFDPIEDAAYGEPNYRVFGNLTIKGITHGIAFDAVVDVAEGWVEARADFSFDRSLYDVRFGSGSFFQDLGDNLILDEIFLSVDIVAEM